MYEGTRRNIVSLLYIKDLALIDPDDNTPLKTLSQFYQNSCYYVFEDTTLDIVFKQFKDGEFRSKFIPVVEVMWITKTKNSPA